MGLTSGLASSWDSVPTPLQGWAPHWGQSMWNRAGHMAGAGRAARPGLVLGSSPAQFPAAEVARRTPNTAWVL
ncbi:unnamed protein product [Gulo gulo]|uniref:Uncharacterized protein n=1 Tax=Gulo gulo TaxID=48420 RepID=A0A9X9Q3C8_GULGU|nr:unnamed protein product [Gulo gulo]